ncbi:hypothetical protein [Phaffia rhodozyma]|uniref:Uncharacterized protein n=1 Tax=Phaffia rhodozyma TaxID=264483 RepID=A0A0F7SM05_PHARH|nr:hypothetical protein [Phaffia rhodozyma]
MATITMGTPEAHYAIPSAHSSNPAWLGVNSSDPPIDPGSSSGDSIVLTRLILRKVVERKEETPI